MTRQSRFGEFSVDDADLSGLGRAEKRAVVAVMGNGLSIAEHADAVGDDPDVVKATLERARAKLRRAGEV